MDLTDLRKQLDDIDRNLVLLTEQRLAVCEQVAEYKITNHKPVLDQAREQEKLAAVRALTKDDRYKDAVEHLFVQIMEDSRALQTAMIENRKTEWE